MKQMQCGYSQALVKSVPILHPSFKKKKKHMAGRSVHVSYNIGKLLLQIWDQKHVPQIIVALEYIQVAMK